MANLVELRHVSVIDILTEKKAHLHYYDNYCGTISILIFVPSHTYKIQSRAVWAYLSYLFEDSELLGAIHREETVYILTHRGLQRIVEQPVLILLQLSSDSIYLLIGNLKRKHIRIRLLTMAVWPTYCIAASISK